MHVRDPDSGTIFPAGHSLSVDPHGSGPLSRHVRFKTYAVLGPLVVLLFLWLWIFQGEGAFKGGPDGKSFEADFAMFSAAGKMLKTGDNPYDHVRLYTHEKAMLAREHLPITAKAAIVRVGNPPLFFWILEPFVRQRFQKAAWMWGIILYGVSALGFLLLLTHLGWRRRLVPLVVFLAMPQVVLGAFYGNVVAFIFLAISGALALMTRTPILAGILLTTAWLKPPIALPLVFLVLLFHAPSPKRTTIGFLCGSAAGLLATLVCVGSRSLTNWMEGLTRYSRDIAMSPDISSLAGLYVRKVGPEMRQVLQALGLLVAIVVTMAVWRRVRGGKSVSLLAVGWLWVAWFLATPYAHFYDEILLAAPVLAILGVNGSRMAQWHGALTIYLLFLSLLVIEWAPGGVQILCLPLLAVTFSLYVTSGRQWQPSRVSLEAA